MGERDGKNPVNAKGEVGVGLSSSVTIAPTPEKVIDEAIEREDWFSRALNCNITTNLTNAEQKGEKQHHGFTLTHYAATLQQM